ncbi:TVP38/TMEM64 family protein [Ruficoccus amylovorans]|uniref:TVP38/TMEM64 family membrane protein n=1 Tax=Ruficoccus amylovorans TaxID=1804625 RepID=A0A842HCC2_9BACT|nr:TVP38/TMEM64 family protein [Ruficoccus amylovorans]MBC2594113.1 TVP38/TMEM64 family protein [Ruficoccus amylovorans]
MQFAQVGSVRLDELGQADGFVAAAFLSHNFKYQSHTPSLNHQYRANPPLYVLCREEPTACQILVKKASLKKCLTLGVGKKPRLFQIFPFCNFYGKSVWLNSRNSITAKNLPMSSHERPPKPTIITVLRLLIGIGVILAVVLAGKELAPHLPVAEKWIEEQGMLAPVYYILLLSVLTFLCVPLDLMLIAAGMMFSLGKGFLYIVTGLYLSQSLIFWVSRLFLHKHVQRLVARKPKLRKLNAVLDQQGIKLLVLIRLAPIPASPVSYLMGASPMSFRHFSIANLGLLPMAFVSQYLGYAAIHATRTTYSPHHVFNLHDAVTYGGLLIAVAVVGFIGHLAHKTLNDVEENA